jgi:hypothetical protein
MLFDLRGRHRRRAVKVIYIGLAVLIGGGLVLFGVGTGTNGGGLLNAASEKGGSGGASYADQIKKYRKQTQQQPHNEQAWLLLTEAQLHEAGGEAYVTSTGQLTDKGRELYKEAAQSWSSYIALNPRSPSVKLAKESLRVFDEEGLNEPAKAVQALQIIVAAEPKNVSYLAQLAKFAYLAKNPHVGDLAAAKAVSLAPATQRTLLKNQLAELKKNPSGEQTYTTTTNGKTFVVKKAPNGTYTGTAVTTKTSTGGTSTAKK